MKLYTHCNPAGVIDLSMELLGLAGMPRASWKPARRMGICSAWMSIRRH
jgi:hypothetical protein